MLLGSRRYRYRKFLTAITAPRGGARAATSLLELFPTASATPLITEFGTRAGMERAYCFTDAAADLEAGSSQYFSHAGTDLLRGGATWYRCGWIKLESVGVVHTIQSCRSAGPNHGYVVRVTAGDVLEVDIPGGTATHGTALSAATWYFWEARYDGTNVGIALNGGAFTEAAVASYTAGANPWRSGAMLNDTDFFDGLRQMDAGVDGAVAAGTRTSLYNAGAGVTWQTVETLLGSGAFCFPYAESTGARLDTIGALSLTAGGSPTAAAGLITSLVVNNASCKQVTATAGVESAKPLSQATMAVRPIWIDGADPYLDLDGANDYLITAAWAATVAVPRVIFCRGKFDTVAADDTMFDGIATAGESSLSARAADADFMLDAGTVLAGGTEITTLAKFTAKFKTAASTLRINGVEDIPAGDAGAETMTGLLVGTDFTGGQAMDGRIYHIAVVSGDLSVAQMTAGEALL